MNQDREPFGGAFLVNGTRCRVTVDDEGVSWSALRKLVRIVTYPGTKREQKSKPVKRVEFAQVIGLKKTHSLDRRDSSFGVKRSMDDKHDTANNSGQEKQEALGSQMLDVKHDRIKVYYSMKSSNKSAGQLFELKKLVFQLLAPSAAETETVTATKSEQSRPPATLAASSKQFNELYERLERQLEIKRQSRPKRLLIFVNPFGGKGKAAYLYKTQVRRLLELAGIEAKLVITQHANHGRDTIEDPQFNIEYFDGIVCVGGDGMFSELMHGLLFRYNSEKILKANMQINAGLLATEIANDTTTGNKQSSQDTGNNHLSLEKTISGDEQVLARLRRSLGGIGEQFVSPPIPVGVIGAGSTDANSFGLIGTNDVTTATLHIILGNQTTIDVCSVHSVKEDRLLRFVSTFVAYGYFGDVIRESEKLRWLGPSRYDITGFNNLLKNRTYQGVVRILISSRDGSPLDLKRCHSNCESCYANRERRQQNDQSQLEYDDLKLRLIEERGSFIGVNAAVTACRCPQTRKGFSPSNHLANGCADLILVRPCTRIQYIQYLLRTGWTKKSAFDLKYVEAYRCRQFEFIAQQEPVTTVDKFGSTASSSSSASSSIDPIGSNLNSLNSKQSSSGSIGSTVSSWNVDGEILNEQSIRVKVNNQLLRVFGTGEPEL